MTKKHKVLIAIATILAASLVYIACDLLSPYFWLQSFQEASIDGFICGGEPSALSDKEQQEREKRARNLNRALKNTIGLYARWGGHAWFNVDFNKVRPEKLYQLQKLLTIEDWEILSQMYIDKREYYEIIHSLFAVNGEGPIAVLECKIKNGGFVEQEKARLLSDLEEIQALSESPRFIYEYQPINNSYIQAVLISVFLLIISAFILAPIGVFIALVVKIYTAIKSATSKEK